MSMGGGAICFICNLFHSHLCSAIPPQFSVLGTQGSCSSIQWLEKVQYVTLALWLLPTPLLLRAELNQVSNLRQCVQVTVRYTCQTINLLYTDFFPGPNFS